MRVLPHLNQLIFLPKQKHVEACYRVSIVCIRGLSCKAEEKSTRFFFKHRLSLTCYYTRTTSTQRMLP